MKGYYFEAKPDFSGSGCVSVTWLIIYLSHHYAQILFLSSCWVCTQNKQRVIMGSGVMDGAFSVLSLPGSLVPSNRAAREGQGCLVLPCWHKRLAVTWFFVIV